MEYDIKLEQQDIQTLIAGLGELPMKIALNTLGKIQTQVAQQDAARAVPLSELTGSGKPNE